MSRKTVGLGSGLYQISDNFPDGSAPIDFELERIVDEQGNQLQATNHEGARPFNKEELDRIQRVSTCIACHQEGWSSEGNAPTDELHRKAIEDIVRKSR
jgi:hypothetical protein